MKRALILCLAVLAYFTSNAQKKQNVYFLNKKGKEVKVKDSADFVRIIQEPDSGETNYVLYEFYMDDKKKAEGRVSAFENRLAYEGILVNYDRKGIKTSRVNYKNGAMLGMAYYYYANGKLKKQVEHLKRPIEKNAVIPSNLIAPLVKVIFLQDSLEVVAVKDGNGHAIEKSGNGKTELIEEGDYKDGFRDGTWTGRYTDGHLTYKELFANGKFVSGESIAKEKKYTYTKQESPPTFDGGMSGWNDFIARSTKYPVEAQRNGISGKVYASFVIDAQGKVTDIKIERSVNEALDEEARRVLQTSPRWNPGSQKGIPVRVKYSQTFNFNTR